MSWGLH